MRHARWHGGDFFVLVHAFLEALDGTAKILADVLELAGAEHYSHNQQNNQPVPDGHCSHGLPPSCKFDSIVRWVLYVCTGEALHGGDANWRFLLHCCKRPPKAGVDGGHTENPA